MCARILTAVRADPSPLNSAKLAGAPRTAFPPRYATVATVCRNNARAASMSGSKLFEMMIHVPVDEDAPRARRELAERRMLGPRVRRTGGRRAVEQRLYVGDIVRERRRLSRDQLRRRRRPFRERRDVDDQLLQRRIPDRQMLRRNREVAHRHPQTVGEMADHLRRGELAPPCAAIPGDPSYTIAQRSPRIVLPNRFHVRTPGTMRLQQVTAPSAFASSLVSTSSTRHPSAAI